MVRSVADDLRREAQEDLRALSAEARIDLALRLGEDDLESFRRSRGLDRAEAIRQLQLRRQTGRRPSRAIQALLG